MRHVRRILLRCIKPPRQSDPRRRFAGQNGGARRRTNRAGRIEIGQDHALLGEPVDVRRFIDFPAVEADIAPAEIVDEDKKNVRPILSNGKRYAGGCKE